MLPFQFLVLKQLHTSQQSSKSTTEFKNCFENKQLGDLLNSMKGFVSRMTRKNERKVPGWERWRRHRLRRGQWSERKRIRKKETIEIRGERKIVSLLCVFVSQMNIMHYLSCVFVLCEWIILYNFVPYWANYYPHM